MKAESSLLCLVHPIGKIGVSRDNWFYMSDAGVLVVLMTRIDGGDGSAKAGEAVRSPAILHIILHHFSYSPTAADDPGCVKSRKKLGRWWASPKYERFCINIVIINIVIMKSTWNELLLNIGVHLLLSQMTISFHTLWTRSSLLINPNISYCRNTTVDCCLNQSALCLFASGMISLIYLFRRKWDIND